MLKFIQWFKSLFSFFKPDTELNSPAVSNMPREVRFKMFVGQSLGLGILFTLYEELGRGETIRNKQGPDISRYRNGTDSGDWGSALVCYGAERTLGILKSGLAFVRIHEAYSLFYDVFGEKLGGEEVDEPLVGCLVLFGSENNYHIGVVSRTMSDSSGKANKWWYIAGNEGRLLPKVKEKAGHRKKNLISFISVPTIKV